MKKYLAVLCVLSIAFASCNSDAGKADKADNSRKIWTIYVFLVWYNVYFVEEDFKPINDEWVKNRIKTA